MSAEYFNETIHCSCGHSIHTVLEADLISEVNSYYSDETASNIEESICDNCGEKYELEIEVEKRITINYSRLISKGRVVKDNKGNDFNLDDLRSACLGDHISLSDGTYIYGGKEYKIENFELVEVWSVSNSNQLNMLNELIAN